MPFICDVSREDDVISTITKIAEQSNGVIDVLVNVAGVDIIADLEKLYRFCSLNKFNNVKHRFC